MKVNFLIVLTVLALLAVAHAQDDDEDNMPAKKVMKTFACIRKFINEDPAGQTVKDISMKLKELCVQMRMKIREGLKEYLKTLIEE
ncbi:unnamed protein product [Hymenolepis diminuta]|nr:unnamed protein product [Hymenolepis diminuta]